MALEDYRGTMQACTRCSYCKWIPFAHVKSWRFASGCPSIAYRNFQAYSAGGRLTAALSLLEGRSDCTDKFLEIVYECNLCGLCDVACKLCRYNMEPLEALRQLRFKLVADGQTLPRHKPYIGSLRKQGNMLLKARADRGKWAEGLGIKSITEEPAEVVFFAGCQFSYDAGLRKVARDAVTLLKNAGVDIGIMGADEHCCGGQAYDMGYREDFVKCAGANIGAWTKAGVKTVVTPCSDCYHAFKRLYPKETGSGFEVLHTVEYIERLIGEGKIKFSKSISMKVTYHDPCHLGRQGEPYVPWDGTEKLVLGHITRHEPPKPRYNGARGIYEPPRNILRAIPGLELVEMERNREYAWCCGAGGGVKAAYPDFSNRTAAERIEEAVATGAGALVTACPWCENNFKNAVTENGIKMKVFDVMELVQQAI